MLLVLLHLLLLLLRLGSLRLGCPAACFLLVASVFFRGVEVQSHVILVLSLLSAALVLSFCSNSSTSHALPLLSIRPTRDNHSASKSRLCSRVVLCEPSCSPSRRSMTAAGFEPGALLQAEREKGREGEGERGERREGEGRGLGRGERRGGERGRGRGGEGRGERGRHRESTLSQRRQ